MFTFLVILIALIAVLMVLVVLVQSGKGGGLAGIAAGGATTQILGSRQAPDILEKATWTLGTAFIVLCILTNFFIDKTGTQESVIQGRSQQEQAQPAPTLPQDGQTAPAQQAPAPAPPASNEAAPSGGNTVPAPSGN